MRNVQKIEPEELLDWIRNEKKFQLIDMSDDQELSGFCENVIFLQYDEIFLKKDLIDRAMPVIFACRFGEMSFFVIYKLIETISHSELYSLSGGIKMLKEVIKENKT